MPPENKSDSPVAMTGEADLRANDYYAAVSLSPVGNCNPGPSSPVRT